MNERLKQLRKSLGLTQEEFSKKIGIKRNTLANYEIGRNEPIDAVFFSICSVFNVNENWLRYGQGSMFVEPSEFSLNEYAKKNNLSELEFDLIKAYMDLDVNARNEILSSMKAIFDKHSEIAATKESYIDKELESYRQELEAELKGEEKSSVLGDIEEKREAN